MNRKLPQCAAIVAFLTTCCFMASALAAQTPSGTISGKVVNSSGAAVANAKIAAKNAATGQVSEGQTDSAGNYTIPELGPGDYEISVSADRFNTAESKVSVTPGGTQTVNVTLTAALSLQDLGISTAQTRGNPKEQARLNKRSRMLKIHQELGLITLAPLVATVATGFFAGGKPTVTSSTDRDLHAALGSATAGLYFASAYYAIFAPKIHGTKTEGNIKVHKALALIHGPGMILTPILGAMAFSQRSKGERVHGIAHYHGQVAILTVGAYGAAILSVSLHSGPASHGIKHALAIFGVHHQSSPLDATLTDSRAAQELTGAPTKNNVNEERAH